MRKNPVPGAIHDPAIRLDRAVNQTLVQAVDGFDHTLIRVVGVLRKHDPGSFARHGFLNHHRHRTFFDIQPDFPAVEQSRIRPE